MKILILAVLAVCGAFAQTSIVGGGRDFEGAVRIAGSTHTVRHVSSLPASCAPATGAYSGEAVILTADNSLHYCSATNTWTRISSTGGGGGSGDVAGPASATDNALTRFDGTTGKVVKSSGAVLDDSGNLTLPGTLAATAIDISGSGPAIFGGNRLPETAGLANPPTGEYSLSVLDTGALATRVAGQAQRIYPAVSEIIAIPAANGLVAHTGSGGSAARSVAAGDALIAVANGDAVAGNPTVSVASPSGNGTSLVTTAGAQTSGDCVSIDANGNHVAAGAPCGSGGGGSGAVFWDVIRAAKRSASSGSSSDNDFQNLGSPSNPGIDNVTVNFGVTSAVSGLGVQYSVAVLTGDDLVNPQGFGAISYVPIDWNSTDVRIVIRAGNYRGTPAAGSTARLIVSAACPNGDVASLNLANSPTVAQTTPTLLPRQGLNAFDAIFSAAALGCSPGDDLFIAVRRDQTHVDDNHTGDISVMAVNVRYVLQ